MSKVKQYFVTGLITIIPVFLTIYVLMVIFQFFDGILGRFLNEYLKDKLGFFIPGLGLILSLTVTFLVGFFASRFVSDRISQQLEKWFASLPLIKNIYPAFKQLAVFLLAQKEMGFKRVVLAEYPSAGLWSVGFITSEQCPKINKLFNQELVAVFIPNSPGPLTGYVIYMPKDKLKFPDISVNDALRIIISGGVLTPQEDSLKNSAP